MEKARVRNRAYGKEIQRHLLEIEMSQRELAELVGIDPKRMSDIIRGVFAGWKHREKIAEVLGIPFDKDKLQAATGE